MPQATIHVVPRPYQAWIENGLLNRSGSILSELLPQSSRIFVVTVPPVRKRWSTKFMSSLKAAGFKPEVIVMPDGEPSKRLANVEAMAEKLAKMGADRKAVIIALSPDCWPHSTCVESNLCRSPPQCWRKWMPL